MAVSSSLSALKSFEEEMKRLGPDLGNRMFLPGTSGYTESLESYFSQQEATLDPYIIVKPQSAEEVSLTIKSLTEARKSHPLQFAIRSGGKGTWGGVANIRKGVTIDLAHLNQIVISPDQRSVRIGPGNKWGDVYATLGAAGLAIAGGRDSTVGVGGLITGGGMSYFGPQTGFVCDSVTAFEVVLANGDIVTASEKQYSDLYKVLKGGSNNFGVVTSFHFAPFPFGEMFGGSATWLIDTAPQQLDALYHFTQDPNYDIYSTVIMSFALYNGSLVINDALQYTKPVNKPPALQPFLSIEPSIADTTGLGSLLNITVEQAGFNSQGHRQAQMTTTFGNDRSLLQYILDRWRSAVPTVAIVRGIQWSLSLQPLPLALTHPSINPSENVLGIETDEPLVLAVINISWDDEANDDLLQSTALRIIDDVDTRSKSIGKYNRFKYLNYAFKVQDVIGGYGTSNKAFMQDVSKKYDPLGLFQEGLPGGFKLFRDPSSTT